MSKTDASVGLDSILQKLGPFGKYNIVNYALLLFPIYLAGMYSSVYVFEAPEINHRCQIAECESQNDTSWLKNAIPTSSEEGKCKRYRFHNTSDHTCSGTDFNTTILDSCTAYVYDGDSIVKDFDLACQEWKRTLVGTLHNAGLFISLPVTGIISDKYGRKVALSIAALMLGVFGFIRSYSVNYLMFLLFEFLETAMGAGAYSTAFVLAMELVGPKGRVLGNTVINIVYVFGGMTFAGLAWWLQNWRVLIRVIYSPAVLVVSYLWILNESVRWLLSKSRPHEAVHILKKAAIMNKVELTEDQISPLYDIEKKLIADSEECEAEETEKSNFMKIISSRIILKRLAVCSFLWITCTFIYYGLSLNAVSLGGNKYVNFMLVVFVEIPANVLCVFVLDRFGRKRTLIATYVLSACFCIGLSLLPQGVTWASHVLFFSGKFFITVAYSSVYIYVSEVFPTNVRQSLLAICSSVGRVGSSLAPQTPLLKLYYANLPAIFFGSMALIASVMVFTLPETNNVPLPNTIEEVEQLSRRKNQTDDS